MPRKTNQDKVTTDNGTPQEIGVPKQRNVVPLDTKIYHWIMDESSSVVFFVNHKKPIAAYTLNHLTGILTDFSKLPGWESSCRAILRNKENPAELICALSDKLTSHRTYEALVKSMVGFINEQIKAILNLEYGKHASDEPFTEEAKEEMLERLGQI